MKDRDLSDSPSTTMLSFMSGALTTKAGIEFCSSPDDFILLLPAFRCHWSRDVELEFALTFTAHIGGWMLLILRTKHVIKFSIKSISSFHFLFDAAGPQLIPLARRIFEFGWFRERDFESMEILTHITEHINHWENKLNVRRLFSGISSWPNRALSTQLLFA